MSRNHEDRGQRLPRRYEGPEVLAELLTTSGCELSVEDVHAEFECAVEEGSSASEIIPLLWELEPTFKTPEQARRTFSNLFGLWDLVAKDAVADLIVLGDPDPDAPLSPEYVDGAWRKLEDLEGPAFTQARHRFDNLQADLGAFLFDALSGLDPVALEEGMELAFETWYVLDQARGEAKLQRPALKHLLALHAQADDAAVEVEPALADMATQILWEQNADDERPLPEDTIPAIERALRTVRRGLVAAR